jgi:hypothetical protein
MVVSLGKKKGTELPNLSSLFFAFKRNSPAQNGDPTLWKSAERLNAISLTEKGYRHGIPLRGKQCVNGVDASCVRQTYKQQPTSV